MMENNEILKTALEQSALDIGCAAEDLQKEKSAVFPMPSPEVRKRFYKKDMACLFISYGNCTVASAADGFADIANEYVARFESYACFEPPALGWLDFRLTEHGYRVGFIAEYYLPDVTKLEAKPCEFELRRLGQKEFSSLYLPEWSNALCKDRRELDVLAFGAYDAGKLVGLAGCSEDAENMWQIGVDVLPEYRRKGIASSLTSMAALETLERGMVPFYCSAWSNIRSVRNAVKCGFIPAWVEMGVCRLSDAH